MTKRFIFLSFVFLAVATASLFGPWHFAKMQMNEDGEMNGCPFMGMAVLCKMSVLEHAMILRGMLTSLSAKESLFNVLILVLTLALAALTFQQHWRLILLDPITIRHKLHSKQGPYSLSSHYLREAFADGILNPKLF